MITELCKKERRFMETSRISNKYMGLTNEQ